MSHATKSQPIQTDLAIQVSRLHRKGLVVRGDLGVQGRRHQGSQVIYVSGQGHGAAKTMKTARATKSHRPEESRRSRRHEPKSQPIQTDLVIW